MCLTPGFSTLYTMAAVKRYDRVKPNCETLYPGKTGKRNDVRSDKTLTRKRRELQRGREGGGKATSPPPTKVYLKQSRWYTTFPN